MTTKTISVGHLGNFESKLAELNRKARKLGYAPITYDNLETHYEKD